MKLSIGLHLEKSTYKARLRALPLQPTLPQRERESNDFGSWGGEVGSGGRVLNLESSTNREIRPHLVEPSNCLVLS